MYNKQRNLQKWQMILSVPQCGSSSVGRASAFQAEGREFESRLPLFYKSESSSVGRASVYQTEGREFESRLSLSIFKWGISSAG